MWDDEKNENGNIFNSNEYKTSTELDKDYHTVVRASESSSDKK